MTILTGGLLIQLGNIGETNRWTFLDQAPGDEGHYHDKPRSPWHDNHETITETKFDAPAYIASTLVAWVDGMYSMYNAVNRIGFKPRIRMYRPPSPIHTQVHVRSTLLVPSTTCPSSVASAWRMSHWAAGSGSYYVAESQQPVCSDWGSARSLVVGSC